MQQIFIQTKKKYYANTSWILTSYYLTFDEVCFNAKNICRIKLNWKLNSQNFRLFQIQRIISSEIYKLKPLVTIQTPFVFYTYLSLCFENN